MSGHTPGPWVIDEFHAPSGIYKIRAEDSALCLIHSVAEGDEPSQEATANARLIAAAPGLLRALKVYVIQHEHERGCPCTSCKQADDIARDALAKAEGR